VAVSVKVRVKSSGDSRRPLRWSIQGLKPSSLKYCSQSGWLRFSPSTSESRILLQEYSVVGGTTAVIRSLGNIHVQLLVEDREMSLVEAIPLISEREGEVMISDSLASKLRISP